MAVEAYVSQQKNQLLDSLENQVRFSQLVAVVTGDKGIGKSFLIQKLQKRIEHDVLIASIDASLAMNEEQLEQSISLQLGLYWQENPISLEKRIEKNLTKKILIAIDDAHLLSASCLDYLLQLNQKQLALQESVLFILLAGDITLPSMISELKTFEQHQEMCVVFQINPIRQHEIQPMIAGFSHDNLALIEDLTDEKKLNYFWQLSKGNPAELYYHLARWFEENTPTEVVEISRDEKTSYFKSTMYIFITVILITALIFQDEINTWIGSKDKLLQVENKGNENIPKFDTEVLKQRSSDGGSPAKQKTTNQNERNPIQVNQLSEEFLALEAENQQTDSQKMEIDLQRKTEPVEEKKSPIKINSKEPKKEVEQSGLLPPRVEKKPTKIKKPIKKITSALTKEEVDLLLLNNKLFVLQWVGVSQLSAANAYKNNHPLGSTMTVYRRSNGNKLLYLVISGQFLSRLQADVAKAEYKRRGYPSQPWVKSMKAVQNEIKSFGKSS